MWAGVWAGGLQWVWVSTGPFSGLADWWFSGLSGQPTVASVLFTWLRRWGPVWVDSFYLGLPGAVALNRSRGA